MTIGSIPSLATRLMIGSCPGGKSTPVDADYWPAVARVQAPCKGARSCFPAPRLILALALRNGHSDRKPQLLWLNPVTLFNPSALPHVLNVCPDMRLAVTTVGRRVSDRTRDGGSCSFARANY